MSDSQPSENPYQSPQSECAVSQDVVSPAEGRGLTWLLFSFEGRIRRWTFWGTFVGLCAAIVLLIAFLNIVIAAFYAGPAPRTLRSLDLVFLLVVGYLIPLVGFVVVMWINFAVLAKRWHDRGKSGWWSLLGLIPYLGALWIWIELGFFPATVAANRFGPDPRRR
jgi:uncharacterized membrane protein YhaH (DUF805 family)